MKKVFIFSVLLVIAIVGIFYVAEQMKYTTFQKVVLDEISVDDVYKIVITRYSDNARISISDKVIIEKVFDDFSGMELKKDNANHPSGDYAIRIYANHTSELGMQLYKDENIIWITKGQKGSNFYKVVNDIDYLDVIENEKLNWNITEK